MILDQNHVIVVGPKDPLYQRRRRMPFRVGCSVKNTSSIIVTSYLYSYLSSLSMFTVTVVNKEGSLKWSSNYDDEVCPRELLSL
jgi:hypothetical protein